MDTYGRRPAFAIAAAVIAIVSVAVARLPDSFIAQLERGRFLTEVQAGWAYRLLAVAALAQAIYAGFILLRPERVVSARTENKPDALSNAGLFRSAARVAAFLPILTIVYGLAALWVTGERGGFWLFVLLAVVQGAWYYRLVGDLGRLLKFQPEPHPRPVPGSWVRVPKDWAPAIARGLRPIERSRHR